MPTKITPYLHFLGNARQALEFYQSVFGGELAFSTFAEFHVSEDPAEAHKIMHGQLDAPNGLTLMAADTPNSMSYTPGSSITVTLSGDDEAELTGFYNQLSAGGEVQQPLEKAPWGDSFGMFVDRFGVEWMVNIAGQPA